jgi:hypothetical protein
MSERPFDSSTGEMAALRAKALCGAGRLAWYTGDLDGAITHLEHALTLARGANDEITIDLLP